MPSRGISGAVVSLQRLAEQTRSTIAYMHPIQIAPPIASTLRVSGLGIPQSKSHLEYAVRTLGGALPTMPLAGASYPALQ
jgi:hypothetical protein